MEVDQLANDACTGKQGTGNFSFVRGGLESLNWLGWILFFLISYEAWLRVLKPCSHLCSKRQTIPVTFEIGPHNDFTGKCQPSTHIIETVKIREAWLSQGLPTRPQ